ncbi:MAG: SurA N-terminal domain-containing protein [Deltaproteobacteria bacterium]|nr:SurA N-terminal domain-containing protein [Deltaproteobacteria bacterium]
MDRVIAVVDNEVITYSELLREARVALVKREGEQIAGADLGAELLASFLDYLINQTMIAARARRVGGVEVSEQDVDREAARFAQRFRTPAAYQAFLRRFDISEEVLRDTLRRDLRSERYIQDRLRAWRVDAGDADATAAAVKRMAQEMREGVELRVLGPSDELELQSP